MNTIFVIRQKGKHIDTIQLAKKCDVNSKSILDFDDLQDAEVEGAMNYKIIYVKSFVFNSTKTATGKFDKYVDLLQYLLASQAERTDSINHIVINSQFDSESQQIKYLTTINAYN